MTAFDYNTIGRIRIEKDRALARIEALTAAGDLLAAHATRTQRQAWEKAKAYDGAPPRVRSIEPADLAERDDR